MRGHKFYMDDREVCSDSVNPKSEVDQVICGLLWIKPDRDFDLKISGFVYDPFMAHLKQPGDEDRETDGLHDVGEVLHQGLAASFHPQVQRLCLVLVVEVG